MIFRNAKGVSVPRYGCKDKGAKEQHLISDYFNIYQAVSYSYRVHYNYNNDLAVGMGW